VYSDSSFSNISLPFDIASLAMPMLRLLCLTLVCAVLLAAQATMATASTT
jgi:hypothetical protein